MKVKDLTGNVFGRLTVTSLSEERRNHEPCWNCKCECGKEVTVRRATLVSGKTRSCGCLRNEVSRENALKHRDLSGVEFGEWTVLREAEKAGRHRRWLCQCVCGHQKPVFQTHLLNGTSASCRRSEHWPSKDTPGYASWKAMKARCSSESHPHYRHYGGRGIKVCDRWLESFANFYADMGPRPDGTSLDRIDSDGDYSPQNCRWATAEEQQNNKRTNRFLECEGQTLTVAQLARLQSVRYTTLHTRLKRQGAI